MKSHTEYLTLNVPTNSYHNITPRIETALRASGVQEGIVLVNAKQMTLRAEIPVVRG